MHFSSWRLNTCACLALKLCTAAGEICFKLLCKRAACSVAVCARALRSCGPKVLPRPEDAPTLFSDPYDVFDWKLDYVNRRLNP